MTSNDPYEAAFYLICPDFCTLNKNEKDTLATASDFCVVEGWILVRMACPFLSFLEMPGKSFFEQPRNVSY